MLRTSRTIFLFVFFLGLFFPTTFVFAQTCACTSTESDCQFAFVASNEFTDSNCEKACKNLQGAKFQSAQVGEQTEGDIIESQCKESHQNFLTNQTSTQAPTANKAPTKAFVTPSLNVEIPGLTFSDAASGPCTSDPEQTCVKSNFLANYLNGIYTFLLGISITIAIIMIMVGGFQYVIAAGGGDVSKGKKRITNAVTGLILLLCIFLVLKTTNPQLVLMKMMELQNVNEVPLPPPLLAEVAENGDTTAFDPSQGTAEVVDSPQSHKKTIGPDGRLTNDDIVKAAATGGIDECFLWSFAKKESGGRLHAIGHDEAYPKNDKPVNSRKEFLMSGKKYGGSSFNPPASVFDYKTMNSFQAYNDDRFQPNNPPHYGLDWRFRHGIGYLQLTIFPEKNGSMGKLIQGPNGPEWARKIRGKWFTVTDLLNADTALEASIRFVGPNCGKKTTVVAAMKCTGVSNAAMNRALTAYKKCPLKKTMTISDEDLKTYPAKK